MVFRGLTNSCRPYPPVTNGELSGNHTAFPRAIVLRLRNVESARYDLCHALVPRLCSAVECKNEFALGFLRIPIHDERAACDIRYYTPPGNKTTMSSEKLTLLSLRFGPFQDLIEFTITMFGRIQKRAKFLM